MLPWRRNTLDVIQNNQIGVEGVSRRGHVAQIIRRLTECEPVAQIFQRVETGFEPAAVLLSELPITDRLEINTTQTGKLTIQQDGRRHLDIADHSPKRIRQPQGIDDNLHSECRLTGSRRSSNQCDQSRPDLQFG